MTFDEREPAGGKAAGAEVVGPRLEVPKMANLIPEAGGAAGEVHNVRDLVSAVDMDEVDQPAKGIFVGPIAGLADDCVAKVGGFSIDKMPPGGELVTIEGCMGIKIPDVGEVLDRDRDDVGEFLQKWLCRVFSFVPRGETSVLNGNYIW